VKNDTKYAIGAVSCLVSGIALLNQPFGLHPAVEFGLTITFALVMSAGSWLAVSTISAEYRRTEADKEDLRHRIDQWVANGGAEQLAAARERAKQAGIIIQASLKPDYRTLAQPVDF
jgi:hypothetical protein